MLLATVARLGMTCATLSGHAQYVAVVHDSHVEVPAGTVTEVLEKSVDSRLNMIWTVEKGATFDACFPSNKWVTIHCYSTTDLDEKPVETVFVWTGCAADIDRDGKVTKADLDHFLKLFYGGDPGADIDDGTGSFVPDTLVKESDLLAFLAAFEDGCGVKDGREERVKLSREALKKYVDETQPVVPFAYRSPRVGATAGFRFTPNRTATFK